LRGTKKTGTKPGNIKKKKALGTPPGKTAATGGETHQKKTHYPGRKTT